MGHKKLIRFAEIKTFPHVLEYPQDMAGHWSGFFGNQHPITLELACGKGEYAIGLARMYPDRNTVGVDVKGNRIWVGARQALAGQLSNVAFLRSQIEFLPSYFRRGEVNEIWLTFPDPQLRASRAKKRLTHPRFLQLYREVLAADGLVHLKTDSPVLYAFTQRVISLYGLPLEEASENVYSEEGWKPEVHIRTYYESLDIAQSRRVHYLAFRLNDRLEEEGPATLLYDWIHKHEPAPTP